MTYNLERSEYYVAPLRQAGVCVVQHHSIILLPWTVVRAKASSFLPVVVWLWADTKKLYRRAAYIVRPHLIARVNFLK